MNGIIHITAPCQSVSRPRYIPVTVDKMAAGTELDIVEAPVVPTESCSSPPQTYPGCYGLPYQDHNYGAPPPISPKAVSPVIIDHIIETTIESATVTIETSQPETSEDQVDDSITRCICNFTHDDGYMICCDKCSVWQHIDCMGIERDRIPDAYCCELCEPRIYDKERAIAIQTQKRKEMTDGSSSDDEKLNYTATSGRTPTSIMLKNKPGTTEKKRKRRDSAKSDKGENKKQKKAAKKEKPEKQTVAKNNKKIKDGAKKSLIKVGKKLPNSVVGDENACDPWDSPEPIWTDTYEEAKFNQYSPDIEAVLALNSLNGAHWAEPSLSQQLQVQLCKVTFIQDNKRGLQTISSVSAYQTLIEYKGSFMQRDQYDLENNFYKEERPYVLFYNKCDHMDLCVDATKYGNDARFVRRSCAPNAEVRHVVDSGSISLFICSTKDIAEGSEVTIPFDFNFHDCDYCVDCACNRANCSVKKFFKKSKAKENDVPTRKKRVKLQDPGDPDDLDTTSVVNNTKKKKEKASPLRLAPPTPTIEVENSITSPVMSPEPVHVATATATTDIPATATTQADPAADSSQMSDLDEKKMSREERKMLAIMRAFEKLEKREERRKEALARIEHKKHEEPDQVDVKTEPVDPTATTTTAVVAEGEETPQTPAEKPKEVKKEVVAKKRKTKSHSTPARRRSRMNSGGSSTAYPSTDEESNHERLDTLLSAPTTPSDPANSSQTARAFRFHKTKKHLMTEWLMEKGFEMPKPLSIRTDMPEEPSDSAEFVKCIPSPHNSWSHLRRDSTQHPQLAVVRQASLDSSMGSAKKRWLRQAISETTSTTDSGNSSPIHNGTLSPSMPSPSCSPPPDFVTPLKKRRLARESMSSQDELMLSAHHPSITGTELNEGLTKTDKLLPNDKNGLKPYSPVTPITPTHGGDNLFEKFKSDRSHEDDKLLKLASVESNMSDSILDSGDKVNGVTDTPVITVTNCDKISAVEGIIDLLIDKSVEGKDRVSEPDSKDQSSRTESDEDKKLTDRSDGEQAVTSNFSEEIKSRKHEDLSEGEIVSSDEEDTQTESLPQTKKEEEPTKEEAEPQKIEDHVVGSTTSQSSLTEKDAPIQGGVAEKDSPPIASISDGDGARRENVECAVSSTSTDKKPTENATLSENPVVADASSTVLSTIPFGPASYVSLSEKLASLTAPAKLPSVPSAGLGSPGLTSVGAGLGSSGLGSPTELVHRSSLTVSPASSSVSLDSNDNGLSVRIPSAGQLSSTSPNTSCPTTPTVPGTPPIKRKVSLSEYRKRLKDKSSANNTPVKLTASSSFSASSPASAPPTLPSLPLFSRLATPSKENENKIGAVKTEADSSWPSGDNNKPLSLMERLKKEFGVDAENEDDDKTLPVDVTSFNSGIPGPPPPANRIPRLMQPYSSTSYPYQGVPQPVPPPPPSPHKTTYNTPPSPHKTTYNTPPSPHKSGYSAVATDTSKIPPLLNGTYSLPPQQSRTAHNLSNGPSQPARIKYNNQYYKR